MIDSVFPRQSQRPQQRRVSNLLLDRGFQLKYTGYLVAITVVLSSCLGFLLWRTSHAAMQQSQELVRQGRELVEESRKVSAVVQMNIVRDPAYGEHPELLAAFRNDGDRQERALQDQQRLLEQQVSKLAGQQRFMLFSLCGVLGALVLLVGAAGIVFTHHVAGPVHKMKLNLRRVAEGYLDPPTPLRKGDELVDFFGAYRDMVLSLRTRSERQLEIIERALDSLDPRADSEALQPLHELKRKLRARLETAN
jgi:hypothetical protein